MVRHLFLNADHQLRNGWWIAVFFLVLASILVPVLVAARQQGGDVSTLQQAGIIAVASVVCQVVRRKPLAQLTGPLDGRWLQEFVVGSIGGAALMLVPALVLLIGGWVAWHRDATDVSALVPSLLIVAGGVLAEELLFRGFLFQRLIAGLGQWPAQVLVAGYFLLTHLNNPGMTGGILMLASVNIFLASILFGLAFVRTGSLAMPLGLHIMANWMQGGVLGFGVSGERHHGVLEPVVGGHPAWLTGGPFGLEASAPGLLLVVVTIVLLYPWTPAQGAAG